MLLKLWLLIQAKMPILLKGKREGCLEMVFFSLCILSL